MISGRLVENGETSKLAVGLLLLITIPVLSFAQPSADSNHQTTFFGKFDVLLVTKDTDDLVFVRKNESTRKISLTSVLNISDYASVAADQKSDTLFFTPGNGLIRFHNLTSNLSGVIYNGNGSEISDLVYLDQELYWIEDHEAVKVVKVDHDHLLTALIPTVIVAFNSSDIKVHGLAVDPRSRTVFYATWPGYSRTNASIWRLNRSDEEQNSSIMITNLQLPRSLYCDGTHLYWVNIPPGIHFTIQRASITGPANRTTIIKQAHQHASSIGVSCGKVYWTDVVDKRLWVVENGKSSVVSLTDRFRFIIGSGGERECVYDNKSVVVSKGSSKNTVITSLKTSTTTAPSSNGSSIRLCSSLEMQEIGCFGTEHVCVVIERAPLCLSPISSTPPPATPLQYYNNNNTERHISEQYNWPPQIIVIISVLSTLATVMTLLSLYMTLRVRNLSKKPVIRRRLVVSRRTSESSSSSPASVCEMIDIENCCNMNVCETPCYERTLLQPLPQSSTCTNSTNGTWNVSTTKATKEDKRCLLTI